MALRALGVALIIGAAGATELTSATWDAAVSGKSVLVGDVDCTEGGKDLCETHGVRGFPTIKYGDPDELKDYSGGRGFADLKAFAESSLGPQCGPGANIGLCSDKVKAKIEKYMTMSASELQEKIDKALDKVKVDLPLMNKAKGFVAKQENGGEKPKSEL